MYIQLYKYAVTPLFRMFIFFNHFFPLYVRKLQVLSDIPGSLSNFVAIYFAVWDVVLKINTSTIKCS